MPKRKRQNNANYVPGTNWRRGGLQQVYAGGSEVVDIGTATVEGVRVPLELHVSVRANGVFEALLPVPEGYPATEFGKNGGWIVRIFGNVCEGCLSQQTGGFPTQAFYDMRRAFKVPRTVPVTYIGAFYGIRPDVRGVLKPSEKTAFRGIARRCMCALFNVLPRYLPVRESLIVLTASGEVDVVQPLSNAELTPRRSRALVRRMVAEHYQGNIKALKNNLRYNSLANLERRAREQEGLERMYTRAFGLRVMSRGLSMSLMAGTYSTALRLCSSR